jgi:hypothetical protein
MPLETPASPVHPGVRSVPLYYYFPATFQGSAAVGTMAVNILYSAPINLSGGVVDRVGIEITTGVPGNCRLGLYSNANGIPTTLIADFGTLDTGTIAIVELSFAPLRMPLDWCWLCAVFNAAAIVRSGGVNDLSVIGSVLTTAAVRALTAAFTYAPLPAIAPAPSGGTTGGPMMWLRKS